MKKITKLIIFLTLLFIFPTNTKALVETFDRNTSNNYGVNKNIYIDEYNLTNILETPLVDAKDKIYDFSNILTYEEEENLSKQITEFISITNMDMVIITYNLPYTMDYTNEDFAADFYDYNDFGIDFDNYSGVLLFRNTYELDRYYDIYTFGNSQLYFNYDRLNLTLDNIYYDFVNNNYLSGMTTFIDDMSDYYLMGIASEYKDYYVDENGFLIKKFVPPIFLGLLISFVFTFIIMKVLINKNKMVKKSTKADEYLITNSINFSIKEDKYTHSRTSSYRMSSSSGSSRSGGGRSSSRGSSGRGHSRGGGRHG